MLCLASPLAMADRRPKPDPLGAHINSGHACAACHAPSGVHDRAISAKDNGTTPLWGEDVTGYFEKVTCPFFAKVQSPEHRGMLLCLSCHDGNYAPRAMMKNVVYESVPTEQSRSFKSVPTFANKPAVDLGPEISEHPVGVGVQTGCGGAINWDCGTKSAKFAANYGFFVKPHFFNARTVVLCTTCHNPHTMNVACVTKETQSNLYRDGIYPTRHFLRAPYGAESLSNSGNESAQFCRQCHANRSNEMNGSSMGSTM